MRKEVESIIKVSGTKKKRMMRSRINPIKIVGDWLSQVRVLCRGMTMGV